MAIQLINKGGSIPELICLNADIVSLPTVNIPSGSSCWVRDTGSVLKFDGTGWYPFSQPTSLIGSLPKDILQEQLTQTDAVAGVLTFAQPISTVEIYNTDAVNSGTFIVNGLDIVVPSTKSFMSAIGGTPSATVTITGATTYIVSRYVQGVA